MNALWQDLRYAWRTFLNTPGATAVAVVVLSLGIGATAAIFSVTNAVLFRTLPYKDASRVVFVWENNAKAPGPWRLSAADYREYRTQNQVLDPIGAMRFESSALTVGETPERIESAAVSPAIFEILGMKPMLGRSFAPEEDQPDKNKVAILSAGLWQRSFGRDPNVLGRKITLDGALYTVIGVAPPQFVLPASRSEIWVPYTPEPKDFLATNRGLHLLHALGRLRPGISRDRAQSEMRITAQQLAREFPDTNAGFGLDLVPLREQLIGDIRPTLWILMAAVVAVLLIACVNVAHLLLARAGAREKEIAVRTALGANPSRLLRQLLTESVLLAVIAGLFGILIAYWGTALLARQAPAGLALADEASLDWHVLAFTLGVSILTGLAFGLAPALSSARSNLNLVLRGGGRGGTGGRTRSRVRDVLMVCEVASSAALLMGAGLLIRSLMHLQEVSPGFAADHVLTMQLSLPPAQYSGLKVGLFYEQLLRRVASIPGAQTAGVCRFLPLSGHDIDLNFQIEGQPQLSSADQPRAYYRTASGGYFAALGIPLIRGRVFDGTDNQQTPKVAVINEKAARRYWPNENPIGKRVLSGLDDNQWSTIVGVVGDVKHVGLDANTDPEVYYQYLQIPPEAMTLAEGTVALAIRTTSDPTAITSAVRGEVRALDPSLPVFNVQTMQDLLHGSVAQPRFRTFLIGMFAALALVLAALGLYGVVAYSVSQRTTELGVRVALGAQPGDILSLVVSHAAGLALIGLAIGIGLSFAGSRLIARFLFGVTPADPVTLAAVSFVILAVALAAALVPALRAAQVDPAVALRSE
jgi:putative ABC transport system permease protein